MQPPDNNQSSLGNIEQAILSVAQILKDSNVTLGSNKYKFRAYRSAAVNTPSNTWAKVSLDTESFDTNNNFASGTYTVPVTGYYQFNGHVETATAPSILIAAIYKNGVEVARGSDARATPNGSGVSDFLLCAANDTIELWVYTNTVVAHDVSKPIAYNYLSGFLVSVS